MYKYTYIFIHIHGSWEASIALVVEFIVCKYFISQTCMHCVRHMTGHVTHMNALCHTYPCTMSHIWLRHVTIRMSVPCHTYDRAMSHTSLRHVAICMNVPYHTYDCAMSQYLWNRTGQLGTSLGHVTFHASFKNITRVKSYICTSHATHMNQTHWICTWTYAYVLTYLRNIQAPTNMRHTQPRTRTPRTQGRRSTRHPHTVTIFHARSKDGET